MPGLIVDLSSNNPHPIDFVAMKASGVSAVIIKATDGTGYVNPFYVTDALAAQRAGLQVAAYHFAEFGDPVAEANHFSAVAGSLAKILDIETSTNTIWMQAFRAALPSVEMLYGSGFSLPRTIYPLRWEASYGQANPDGPCELWQFTDAQTVGGVSAPVDASRWLGTQAQYDSFFGATPAPSPTPTPTPEGNEMAVTPVITNFKAGQKDVFQVSGNMLYHKYVINSIGKWQNEVLAGPAGGIALKNGLNIPAQTPQVVVADGQILVTVEDSRGFVFLFSQNVSGAATWGVNQLP